MDAKRNMNRPRRNANAQRNINVTSKLPPKSIPKLSDKESEDYTTTEISDGTISASDSNITRILQAADQNKDFMDQTPKPSLSNRTFTLPHIEHQDPCSSSSIDYAAKIGATKKMPGARADLRAKIAAGLRERHARCLLPKTNVPEWSIKQMRGFSERRTFPRNPAAQREVSRSPNAKVGQVDFSKDEKIRNLATELNLTKKQLEEANNKVEAKTTAREELLLREIQELKIGEKKLKEEKRIMEIEIVNLQEENKFVDGLRAVLLDTKEKNRALKEELKKVKQENEDLIEKDKQRTIELAILKSELENTNLKISQLTEQIQGKHQLLLQLREDNIEYDLSTTPIDLLSTENNQFTPPQELIKKLKECGIDTKELCDQQDGVIERLGDAIAALKKSLG